MIETHMNELNDSRNGYSFACLAERKEKTKENPFGFDVAKAITCSDVVVLSLTGEGTPGHNYSNYNGFLKRTDEYIEEISAQLEQPVRSVVAVADYGRYYSPKTARQFLALQVSKPKEYQTKKHSLPLAAQQEYTMPRYIQDIFENVFLERISTNGERIDTTQAAQNIRKAIIIDHCHGGYVALKLEELMLQKMQELGYKKSEQEKILKQLLVISYAPDCPLGISKAQTITFSSATDYQTNHCLKIKDYLQYYEFGIAFFPNKMGNVFYCTQIDKYGIEGNPQRVLKAINPDEWFDRLYKANSGDDSEDKSDDTSYLGEHEFPGFRKYDNMSRAALQMRTYMRRIFKNALIHSCKQKEGEFTPLPSISHLAADNSLQRTVFFRAKLFGYKLWTDMQVQTKLLRRNFTSDVICVDMD